MELADLKKEDVVLDAYSGIGTIGLIAAKYAQKTISVELVPEAVKDSIENAKRNGIRKFEAHEDDATSFIQKYAKLGMKVDVLFTYKDKILSSSGILTQGENVNKYLSNRSNVVDVRPNVRKLDFPNKELLNETGSIVMVTIKGK